jgi:hypothetical protein
MRAPFLASVAALTLVSIAPGASAGKPEPVTSVTLAKTWADAIDEAKKLNVPIVVHSHGFYCGPCWGMHSAVMCNKKYIDFANENTVEVISLDRLEEGVEKKDKRAETYDAKVDGKVVKYLVEFPGMTVEDMVAMKGTKASSYNNTGKIPYTCVVDPWTESELSHWQGSTPVGDIQDAVLAAKKTLAKDHGKGASRKDVRALADAAADATAKAGKGEFAAAIEALAKVGSKADKWADSLKDELKADKQKVVDAAQAALDKVAETKATDAEKARKDLAALASKLKGTGLEDKAKQLLAE